LSDDAYTRSIEALERSRHTLASELASLERIITSAREGRLRGTRVGDVPEAMRLIAKRESVITALAAFGIALATMRAEGIRTLVDQEHRTLADVARLMNLSRQVVSRIYNDHIRHGAVK